MICAKCVSLESLKTLIHQNGTQQTCDYCDNSGTCIESNILFDFIEQQIIKALKPVHELSNYEQGMIFECGSDEPPIFPLWEFLQENFPEDGDQLVKDIEASFTSAFFKSPDKYEALFTIDDGTLEDSNDYEVEWERFVSSIHHNRRYFNKGAEEFLDSLFETMSQDGKLNGGLTQTLRKGTALYRARIANNKDVLNNIERTPHSELGPVPKAIASNQRMTPAGVAAIYCARDRNTCLSELRPIVGDLVVSGEFQPVSDIKLLDLTTLETIELSKVDQLHVNFRKLSHAQAFLKGMTYKLSQPLERENDLGYLSTQVFFEYLRLRFEKEVDGVLFPSVQVGGDGVNLTLFPESSVVIDAKGLTEWDDDAPFSGPKPKLVYVEKSLVFHKIQAVNITSQDYSSSFLHTTDELTRKRFS